MPHPGASVPPEAIRIEDEVWQEAFARREPARPRSQRRLHAIDGGQSEAPAEFMAVGVAAPPPVKAPLPERPLAPAPRTAAAQSATARRTQTPAGQPINGGVPGRRTVTIRGHGAERNLAWPDPARNRPQLRPYERAGFRPDRVAMWAVLLGILLVVVAIASAHG
jgi:hypothetical protein